MLKNTETTTRFAIVRKADGRQVGRQTFTTREAAELYLPTFAKRYHEPVESLRVDGMLIPLAGSAS